MIKKILVLIGLVFLYISAFCQNKQDTLFLFMPKCHVDSLIDSYLGQYNPIYTDSLQKNLINSVHGEFGKLFVIIDYPLETEEYNRFFNIYLNLTQDNKPANKFNFFDFDSIFKSKQLRKTIILYAEGFRKSKKIYDKETAKSILTAVLSLGTYVKLTFKYHTNIFFTIYDHYDKKVLYKKRKMSDEIDPILTKDIEKQIHYMYLEYLKIPEKK